FFSLFLSLPTSRGAGKCISGIALWVSYSFDCLNLNLNRCRGLLCPLSILHLSRILINHKGLGPFYNPGIFHHLSSGIPPDPLHLHRAMSPAPR
ncbi:hypothetical protein B9Z19DRAFT_1163539, partial [Tuber borchii]